MDTPSAEISMISLVKLADPRALRFLLLPIALTLCLFRVIIPVHGLAPLLDDRSAAKV